jgi:hypothetical protein
MLTLRCGATWNGRLSDGVVVAERVADGDDPVARLHLSRVAEPGLRQLRRRALLDQLDEGAVGQRIAADHAGFVAVFLVAFLAIELDADLGGVLDDVVVGEDQAGAVVDDEAGAGAGALLRLLGLLPRRAEKAAEQLVALILGRLGRARRGGRDAHHHRALVVGDAAEGAGVDRAGQRRAVHRRRRRQCLRLRPRRQIEARREDHADGERDHGDQGGVEEGRLAR